MKEIKTLVEEIVNNCRSRDPRVIAKKYNIEIMYTDLGNTKGFYKNILGNKFIAINENLSEFLTIMVLSHELGHAFLHEEDDFIDIRDNMLLASNILEKEANLFAAYLLVGENEDSKVFYTESTYEEKIYRDLMNLAMYN